MSRTTIHNKTARILGTCCGQRLLPGKNDFSEVDAKTLRMVIENDQFRSWQKLGWVSVSGLPGTRQEDLPEAPEAPEYGMELRGEGLELAKSMVTVCSDVELLMLWYENDKRKGVKSAIESRLRAMDVIDESDG